MMPRPRGKCGKVLYFTELDAKIALAKLQWKDRGEKRVQPCNICHGEVFHLTKQDQKTQPRDRRKGMSDSRSIDGESSRAIA
jgi:nitrate/TMAO reductase-like tetraheme cytochrome c subunit